MVTWLIDTFGWMYWTWPSAIFIIAIFTSVTYLSVLGVHSPNVDRKGFFPIETGRGDRLFIGILSSIAIFLIWLGLFGQNILIIPALITVIWFFIEFKWG
ncbi:MAG: hypothetical protein J7L71_02215 [Spirochaetaceae bacterium]|nr:hypothetical protein [Spirochaetaceae bacterium]